MAKKTTKKVASTEVSDYSMQHEFSRTKLPTGEYSGIQPKDLTGVGETPTVRYSLNEGAADLMAEFAERDADLDPQYIWRGKKKGDLNELEVKAPIIYQQEKIFPRMLIEEMKRRSAIRKNAVDAQMLLGEGVEDFDPNAQPGFYNHEEGWKNRMILGDSLQVMASLAENESLRGKVQMVYFDPPYGIRFNSNWQPTTKSTTVKDGNKEDITREPEMVKAFRDTWHDGIHSYLGYLRDRLIVARDLLSESGSCFVQIGDANVHKIRAVMEEVFGEENFVAQIAFRTAMTKPTKGLNNVFDYIIWFTKNKSQHKFRELFLPREVEDADGFLGTQQITASVEQTKFSYTYHGKVYNPKLGWRLTEKGLERLERSSRIHCSARGGDNSLRFARYASDFPCVQYDNVWTRQMSEQNKTYVVQTSTTVIQRCMLMTTDPGDLVLDPTCGSGTTACVAEQWGRRWITIDTSRVAIALARMRLMTTKFPYYLLEDSTEGLAKEMEITNRAIVREAYGKITQGFVYERVPHIGLKSIANNAEIDIIWERFAQESLSIRASIAKKLCLPRTPEEWELPTTNSEAWDDETKKLSAGLIDLMARRRKEIEKSIARTAETEYLYDKPYEDKKRVRVAGPFTVESIAPTRSLIVNPDGTTTDPVAKIAKDVDYGNGENYVARMIDILRKTGVKQAKKTDRITFNSVTAWAGGKHIAAEGWTEAAENQKSKHFAIAFGPEFGSVTRLDMKAATREAMEGGFDVLLYCAFNFEAYVEEGSDSAFGKLKVLHARMNSDLHMATDLKDTGAGNPFIIFGEPDIEVTKLDSDEITVTIKGVDVYDPKKDEVRSDNADDIDCWMLDTDYNEEAFFARHVYFPGRDKVYDAFKKFLNNDIDREEWESVAKTTSRPFPRPKTGRIAVKVINHFGDEVMKIFEV